MNEIFVCPPILLPWLSQREKKGNVLLIDMEVDILDRESIRIDLNLVFSPIALRRGSLTRADFYVGTTGADVTVDTQNGLIDEYSEAQTLNVDYSNKSTRTRASAINMKPTLRIDQKTPSMDLIDISLQAGSEREFCASFSSEERTLAPIFMKNSVRWIISLPRGEKAVRDFLVGNIYLFANCRWLSSPRRGSIEARPADIRFFDADRHPLGPKSSLVMHYFLWRHGVALTDKDGFELQFWEKCEVGP